MNKKFDKTDEDRDQARSMQQGDAEKRQQRHDDKARHGQQQAGDEKRRQQGGWTPGEEGRQPGSGRDRAVDEKTRDEP